MENRHSQRTLIDKYDPNRYFFGTKYKSGDYMMRLPLVYVSTMLEVPLMLSTFSIFNPNSFRVAVIESMGKNVGLKYKALPPNKNNFRIASSSQAIFTLVKELILLIINKKERLECYS